MPNPIHVRFAPSPTGALHIGSIRTLLYNYLIAKQTGGRFILRIEDTDANRCMPNAEQYILESLDWLGIIPDEGPNQGGPFGPYKQTERLPIYQQHIQPLLNAGHAYYAFDTVEEIDAMRERLRMEKVATPQYNSISRKWMKNSFTLPEEQVKEWIATGKPYVIRLKIPHKEWIRFYDQIRGWVKVETSTLDDKVLMKSDGMPTYHFANVVDDYLMQITHVIRGEEWLPSTPIHILLYRYLGWETHMPQFIHLPLLLSPDGNGKLSKRHADQYGFPAFPIRWHRADLLVENGFRESGYLPAALWNFLAFLGWNPGTSQEIFTQEELIAAFSLKRLGKSGAKFDIQKAKWFNGQHIKKLAPAVWGHYFIQEAAKENIDCNTEEAISICMLVKDRVAFPKDFWLEGRFFFFAPIAYDNHLLCNPNKWNQQTQSLMTHHAQALLTVKEWNDTPLKSLLQTTIATQNIAPGIFMSLLRMALTGRAAGPDLIKIMVRLGQAITHKRITTFLTKSACITQ